MSGNINLDTNSYKTTAFGTPLDSKTLASTIDSLLAKMVRFADMDRDSRVKKVGAVALVAIAVVGGALLSSSLLVGMGYITTKLVLASSSHLAIKAVGIALIGLGHLIGFTGICDLMDRLHFQYNVQQTHNKIIEMCGGKNVFYNQTPKISTDKLWDYMGDVIKPEDVNNHPVCWGVDKAQRTFISFYVEPANGSGKAHVETISQRCRAFTYNRWVCGGTKAVFDQEIDDAQLQKIRRLLAGETINGYKLIAAPAV